MTNKKQPEIEKEQVEKKQCLTCLELKNGGKEFFKSFSIWHADGRLPICKSCLKGYVEGKEEVVVAVKEVMRTLDKPFKLVVWEQAISSKKDTLGEYFRLINLNSKHENYDDSISGSILEEGEYVGDDAEDSFRVTEEMIKYWGKSYSRWEYEFLEEDHIKIMTSFECPDYGMEMIMKDICFINLDVEKKRQEKSSNSGSEITKLIKSRSDLMNSANMNPIQSTGAEGNDQITFGTLIKKWENERPVPKFLEDEMKEYIDTFMVGHLAKMEGLTNELTEKYDNALNEYTIDFEEIKKDTEEYDD